MKNQLKKAVMLLTAVVLIFTLTIILSDSTKVCSDTDKDAGPAKHLVIKDEVVTDKAMDV